MTSYLSLFTGDDVETALPWSRTSNSTRRTRQGYPQGLLFFDRLLQLAQVDPLLYPPTDLPALRRLLSAVQDSESFDTLKKSCLVYYLLKDYNDGRELHFSKARRIPKRFMMTTDAYWALDNKQFDAGIKKLCSPGVTPDFIPAILQTLSTQASSELLSSALIVDLVTYAVPVLTDQRDIQNVINAYLRQSCPEEALGWMRKTVHDALLEGEDEGEEDNRAQDRAQEVRQEMLAEMLEICFTSQPPLSSTLEKLLYLPFSPEEDAAILTWINNASSSASSISSAALPLINEWATSRLVAAGRYVEAITILSSSLSSLRTSSQGHSKAQETLKELYAALPPIQRSLVDLNLNTASEQDAKKGTFKEPNGESDTASGTIAKVPWLPAPVPTSLPVPRSLLDARAIDAVLREARAGGPKINKMQDLPMSAGGLLRENSAQPGFGQASGRRDERMDILKAVRRAESPMKGVTRTAHIHRISGSPFRASPAPQLSSFGRREESPFSSSQPGQMKPTVPAFGLSRPPVMQGSRLDFSEQLRRHQHQNQNQQSASQPSTSTPRLPRRVAPEQEDSQTMSTQPPRSTRRQLPPGAFPSSGSLAGSNIGDHTDSEGSDNDENTAAEESKVIVTNCQAPPARSTRGARRQSSVPPQQQQQQKEKLSRQRTASTKDLTAPTPSKKGKKNAPKEVEPTPRRSKRLESAAPEEPEMMEPDADESAIEDSMIHVGNRGTARTAAKTPRRRRP